MSEWLRPRNIVAGFVLVGVTLAGIDKFVDYEAAHAGRVAGQNAREEIEQVDIADQQWSELKQLLADEDLRTLLEQKLQDDDINLDWLIQTVIENEGRDNG